MVARQKIRRVAANEVKARPTVFFAGDCALETRIIYGGVRGGAPRRGGRGRLALDPSTPLRSAQDDTGQGFAEGEASPLCSENYKEIPAFAGMTRMWWG